MRFDVISRTRKEVWRYNDLRADNVRGYNLDEGNGTTNFGLVKAGTIMGLLASGKIRPGGMADVQADYGPGLIVPVDDASNFYVSDVVDIKAGATSKRKDSATVDAGDDPSELTIEAVAYGDSRIRYAQSEHTYDRDHSPGIYHAIDDDGTNVDVLLYLEMECDSHQWEVCNDGGGNTANIIVTATSDGNSRIKVKITDPSANSQPEVLYVTDDGTDLLLDVSCSTDGAGNITSTLQTVSDTLEGTGLVLCALGTVAGTGSASQVVVATAATAIDGTTSGADVKSTVQNINDYINGELAWLITANTIETAADLGATLAATALSGGYDEGDTIASARNVTSVDKTSTPNTITIDGVNVTVLEDDAVMLQDGWEPCGVMEDQVNTIELQNDTVTGVEKEVSVGLEGHAKSSLLIGNCDLYTQLMGGGYVPTKFKSAGYAQSKFAGFILR